MQGSDQDSSGEVFTDVTFDTTVWSDPTAPSMAPDALDAELASSLWIEDVFGETALEPLVEDYCRSVLSIEEITAYRAAAGIAEPDRLPASVLPLSTIPTSCSALSAPGSQSSRCAA